MSSGTITRAGVTAPQDQVVRYNFAERAVHWINSIAYVYCMVTGLALFTPFLFWMATVLGGGPTIRFWHPLMGLVYVVAVFWMNSKWKVDMAPIPEDEGWNNNIKAYIQNQDDKMPPQGRFNAGQKTFWKGMFWCTLLLFVTGIALWFPEVISQNPALHRYHWLLTICVFIHCATALITIALFIIHVYMSVWMTPGSLKSMMDGTCSSRFAQAHHRLWYEKVTGRKR
jgi:formate dehydrogenase subunit gamma